MQSIKPSYLIALTLVVIFFIYSKVSNPYREYSTKQFWENATLESVSLIPDEALLPGNKNGPILMWAAIGTGNVAIIQALVDRGAEINESDGVFKGTPLTGAAGYSKHPIIISKLVELGADINKTVHNDETALMIAAQYNQTSGMAKILIEHGASIRSINKQGKTALDLAESNDNNVVAEELKNLAKIK